MICVWLFLDIDQEIMGPDFYLETCFLLEEYGNSKVTSRSFDGA